MLKTSQHREMSIWMTIVAITWQHNSAFCFVCVLQLLNDFCLEPHDLLNLYRLLTETNTDNKTGTEKETMDTNGLITARKRSLGQGNIFSSVCQEFCSQRGRVPGQVHPPGQVHHPPTPPTRYTHRAGTCWEIRTTSGRYASYRNAFLLKIGFSSHYLPVPILFSISVSVTGP